MSEFFKNDIDLNEAYAAEVNRLNLISEELDAFLKETVRNYPSDKTRRLSLLGDMLTEILKKPSTEFSDRQKIDEIYKLVSDFKGGK